MSIGRSESMRRIRSRDTGPELTVRRLLRSLGYTGYRLCRRDLPGKPDIAFVGRKKAVMMHGCFWHGHSCREGQRSPKSRPEYWLPKIEGNRRRDRMHVVQLSVMGWSVLTLWECELRDLAALKERLVSFLAD